MEPVPYEIRAEDVDEVLSAYGTPQGARAAARKHVLEQINEIDDIVRTAPELPTERALSTRREGSVGERPGDQSYDRRELALAAIEDILIRDGFIEASPDEKRVYPVETDERRDVTS
jgi:hypothetical protein